MNGDANMRDDTSTDDESDSDSGPEEITNERAKETIITCIKAESENRRAIKEKRKEGRRRLEARNIEQKKQLAKKIEGRAKIVKKESKISVGKQHILVSGEKTSKDRKFKVKPKKKLKTSKAIKVNEKPMADFGKTSKDVTNEKIEVKEPVKLTGKARKKARLLNYLAEMAATKPKATKPTAKSNRQDVGNIRKKNFHRKINKPINAGGNVESKRNKRPSVVDPYVGKRSHEEEKKRKKSKPIKT